MKHFIFLILMFWNTCYISAQIFDIETIKFSGDNDKRINLVILSEGYQEVELNQFISDATAFSNDMFSQSPFLEYANYFNVYAIKVPSNESGADHPGTATDVSEPLIPVKYVDTYFNATYDAYGFHRLLYYELDGNSANNTEAIINTVLANNFPIYDLALIIVNSSEYGGTGGEFPISYNGTYGSEIAIHELGHSLFNLKDEYYPGDLLAAEAVNMTQETDPTLVKWKNWLNTNNVGIYPYATSGNAASWNRPHQNCKMRYLDVPFCSVCKEGMVEKLHSIIAPIEDYTPNNITIDNPVFPIDFQLNLIKTIPNTLENYWSLNTTNVASNVDDILILESDLVEGINTVTAVVHDNSPLLKVDNHETLHIYTVTWTINYTVETGIEEIDDEINTLSITVFPNPSESIMFFKLESQQDVILKVDIISIDGKKVNTIEISNLENYPLNISSLSQGIYIANFYNDNTLIARKKIVKQ